MGGHTLWEAIPCGRPYPVTPGRRQTLIQWRSQPVSWLPGNPPSSERREGLTHHNFIECVDSKFYHEKDPQGRPSLALAAV